MTTSSTGEVRVLHVDDDLEFADTTGAFLEREDDRFTVATATSAEEGLARLDEGEFDCVVSDYDMPGRDGIEFLQRVRETAPRLPFILFTGKGSEEVASDAISAGVTDYLQKEAGPEQYALLANRIAQAVGGLRAETNYREIFEKATDGIVVHDPETGEVLDANQRYCEMNGYSREEVVGMSVADISCNEQPYTGAEGRERIHDAVDGDPQVFEWVNETKSGDRLPLEVHLKQTTLGGQERVLALVRDISARKERERELEETNTVLETIVEQLPMGVLIEDSDGTILVANDELCDILAIDATGAELRGRDCEAAARDAADLFADPDAFLDGIDETLARREPVANEELALVDGRTLERDYVPYTLPDGEANLWLYRDVTARKARRQERKRYETIVETTEDGIYLFDADGHFEFVNQRVVDVSGIPESAWQGEHVSVMADLGTLTDDEVTAVEAGIEAVARGDESEVRVEVSPDVPHETRDLEIRLTPHEPDGETRRVLGFSRDVTERTRREEKLSALFDHSPNPIAYTEFVAGEPRIRNVNAAFETVFGYDAADALGEKIDDLVVPPDQRDGADDINERVLAGEQFEVEVRRETTDGVRDFLLHPVPLRPEGRGDRVYAVYHDVTARNEYKQQLERQNERLGDFASIVSHDLRNPLNVATGRLELAQEDCDSPHLDAIEGALDRSQALVDDLLMLAREGETVGEVRPVDLAETVQRCWGTVETEGTTLTLETEQTILADSSRLKQLLENLIRNSVEHGSTSTRSAADAGEPRSGTGRGPPDEGDSVTVTVGDLPDGFYVADDGRGIPGGAREQVFEAGYSTTDGGTGLGLLIIEEVADAHGWDLAVRESESGGARFEVTGVDVVEANGREQ
ncbi:MULTISPECIES: PAS domain S-box protein [Salinibaculum]|uniref:PAS domain S-box protein n=1 Tax=Salinibaculum TaxID=2732368 RepID=UPI0030CF1B20